MKTIHGVTEARINKKAAKMNDYYGIERQFSMLKCKTLVSQYISVAV